MGAQDIWRKCKQPTSLQVASTAMAPMKAMGAMKAGAKPLTKSAIRTTLAEQNELKPKQCAGIMDSLAALATAEVKKAGKFVIPGICMIKTRHKAATKAGTVMAFGKEVKVKAKAARTIVKAYPVAALKKEFK